MRSLFFKKYTFGGLSVNTIVLAILSFSICASADVGDAAETPAISGYGKIHAVSDKKSIYSVSSHAESRSAFYTDTPPAVSKLVFQVSRSANKPGEINPDLEKVARAINLMVADGIPTDHMNVVVLIGGVAADVALTSDEYRKHFGVDNPNLDLLNKLHAVGAAIVVSDQALAAKELKASSLANITSTALSSFTAITSLEQAGYSLASL